MGLLFLCLLVCCFAALSLCVLVVRVGFLQIVVLDCSVVGFCYCFGGL